MGAWLELGCYGILDGVEILPLLLVGRLVWGSFLLAVDSVDRWSVLVS